MIRLKQDMTTRQQLSLTAQLSVPAILAQLSMIVMFFIDAAMVGHLGARQSASIGLVETTTWLLGGLGSAVSMGFSVQVAHAIGANDFNAARRILRQSIVCALLWSIMLTLLCVAVHRQLPIWLGGSSDIVHDASIYFLIVSCCGFFFQMEGLAGSMLKCAGNMKIPSALNITMCVMDVAFNYLFIYVLDLGVKGAAIGTGVAVFITAGLMLYFLLCRSKILGLKGYRGSFTPQAQVVRKAFKIGAPMGLQHLLTGSAYIVITIIVAPLGVIAIAANSFAITVESLCYMPGFGIAEAATTLVGQCLGAKQQQLARSFAHLSVKMGMLTMTVMGALMWVFATELMQVMSPVQDIITLGVQVLRIEAWAEPMFAASIVCNGIFVGAGDTLRPAAMSLGSMWGIRLTLSALLAPIYGLQGVWMAMCIELCFRGLIFLWRLASGKWMNKY
ncbi:MAG: MATE family efflux transporter [Muribaculaceae bacterium]|nr:MATE family efflux transporter [Muribaculaceae bacterium]